MRDKDKTKTQLIRELEELRQKVPLKSETGRVVGLVASSINITDRKWAEEALRKAKDELELQVEKRSAELVEANEKLRQEIEERKRAEKDLRQTKNLLSYTFNALQDLVVVIDKDLRVIMSNWKDHDYISEKDRQAHPYCYEVFMNQKKPCNPCHAMEVFTTGEIMQLEYTNPIDGKIRDIHVLPIFDDEGKVISVIEHLRDITERKQAEIQIRTLSQQLIQSQESERQMISRELHDRVTQDLSSIKIGMDTLFDREPSLSPEVRKNVLEYSQILQKAIGSVRDLSYDLHPPGLDDMGLVHALSMYCDEFAEKSGVKVNFEPVGMSNFSLDSDTELNLYRLVQEGLNNIRKHAHAGQANVKLVGTYPNIILRIEDNGRGFDLQKRMRTVDRQRRMGIRSMAERVSLMQGEMTIQSQPMKGTHIFIKFPYQEKKHGSKENHIDR